MTSGIVDRPQTLRLDNGHAKLDDPADESVALEMPPSPRTLSGAETGVDQEITDSTEHGSTSKLRDVSPPVRVPRRHAAHRQFKVLQQWEGVVTRVDGDAFEAEIHDLTNPSKPPEFVELPFAEISDVDKPLVAPGCVFYWIIGYETKSGQISNVSEIRVRRMPRWSQRDIESIKLKGQELFQRFAQNGQTETKSG